MSAGDERMDSQAYTISEVFAGFNLILTDLVKCLIVKSKYTQKASFHGRKLKNFLGRVHYPLRRLLPNWEGIPPHQTSPPWRLWRLISAPAALLYLDPPSSKNLAPPLSISATCSPSVFATLWLHFAEKLRTSVSTVAILACSLWLFETRWSRST